MENKDFINIERGSRNIYKKYRKKRIDVEQKYTAEHKPYCGRAADMEVKRIIEDRLRRIGKKEDEVTEEMLGLPKFNFDKYGDLKDFELQSTQDAMEKVTVGISSQTVKVGIYKNYVHKPTGTGVSVQILNEHLTEENDSEPDSPPRAAPKTIGGN